MKQYFVFKYAMVRIQYYNNRQKSTEMLLNAKPYFKIDPNAKLHVIIDPYAKPHVKIDPHAKPHVKIDPNAKPYVKSV